MLPQCVLIIQMLGEGFTQHFDDARLKEAYLLLLETLKTIRSCQSSIRRSPAFIWQFLVVKKLPGVIYQWNVLTKAFRQHFWLFKDIHTFVPVLLWQQGSGSLLSIVWHLRDLNAALVSTTGYRESLKIVKSF